MTTPKQVLNYHLKRLENKDPQIRLQAIEQLREIGDATVLEALQALYRNDDDELVRQAAQAAGRDIWSKQNRA